MHQRLIHDASHRAAVKILHVFGPLLRDEELRDAYEEVMPIIAEAIAFYEESLRQEKARLRPMEQEMHPDMAMNQAEAQVQQVEAKPTIEPSR
jgi:hypothetical protein